MADKIDLKRDQNGRFIKGNSGFWLGKTRDRVTVVKTINTSRLRGSYNKSNSGQFKKGHKIKLGFRNNPIQRLYISEQTKKAMTPEVRKIISDKTQTHIKDKSHNIFKVCAKKGENRNPQNNFKKGHTPWNKDGHHSEETKIKQSILKTEFYKQHPEAIVKWYNETRKNIIVPFKDTKIEVKIQNYLKQLGIEFYTHQYIQEIEHGYHCDILIPIQEGINQKTIIECDGIYWHGHPVKYPNPNESQKQQIETDKTRTKELIEEGYRVIRLWENDIKKLSPNKLKEKLMENL